MSRMESMTTARKTKISISLDAEVLAAVDSRAAREKTTRSAVMEQWLRGAARQTELQRLEEETAAYYDALDAGEKARRRRWTEFASRSARKLAIDDVVRTAPARATKLTCTSAVTCYWGSVGKAATGARRLRRRPERTRERPHRRSLLDENPRGTDARASGARREAAYRKTRVLKCEQITTVKKRTSIRSRWAPPRERRMAEVERAVLRAIGIPIADLCYDRRMTRGSGGLMLVVAAAGGGAAAACSTNILHGVDERSANEATAALERAGIGAEKLPDEGAAAGPARPTPSGWRTPTGRARSTSCARWGCRTIGAAASPRPTANRA